MRKLILVITVLFTGILTTAQDTKSTNTLLWRISGRGLTQPSYLYGTMHLTDKRVFQLGDSVYKALEQTQGFAAELDMNRLGTQMVNQMISQEEQKKSVEPVKLKDVLSPETWNKYKESLEKKLHKKADKITVDDLDAIESKLQADIFRKGEMPTFLDAWLFGQARKQGKWVGGIEDLQDQLEHIGDIESKVQMALFDDDYYRGSLDWFIKVYTNQRLDTIDAYMYREEDGGKDFILVKRNVKMARRMDSLSAIRSTLFAVGAAHLPGDSGVIALLRSRGFTVTPVLSSKKINPDKYISKVVDIPWIPVTIKDSSYSLQMPGISEGIEMFESMGIDMKMFFDISLMKMYMTLTIEIPEERRRLGADSLFKGLRNQYSSKGTILKEKELSVNGATGREYRISTEEGEMRMQIVIPATIERVVLNMVMGFTDKAVADNDAEKFFRSFVLNKEPVRKVVVPQSDWTLWEYPRQSFSVEMPVKPRETKDVVSEEGKTVYEWRAIDLKNQLYYGMSVSAMKASMYDDGEDTAYFTGIKDRLKEGFDEGQILDSAFINYNGYPAYRVTVAGKKENESFETKVLSVSRGGLSYYIYVVFHPGDKNKNTAERFLNSFKLLPYPQRQWRTVSAPDGSFTTSAPFQLKPAEDDGEETTSVQRFLVYDSLAAVTSFVDKFELPGWFWYSSDTAFLRFIAKRYTSWDDTLLNFSIREEGPLKTAGFHFQKEGNNQVRKTKLVINGNNFYQVFGNFARQDLPGNYNRFFDDFKVTTEKPGWNRSASRVDQLIEVLKSADKRTVDEVKEWWDALEFTSADIPALQSVLLKLHADFDTTYYSNLNKKLFEKIEFLDTNHSTVEYIRKNYGSITAENEYVKGFVLTYLAGITTEASYSLLKDCLSKYPLNITRAPYFGYLLYDSLKLTTGLYPELMKLGGSPAFWEQVTSLTTFLVDSNLLTKAMVKEQGKYFVATAKKELEQDKDDIEEAGYQYSDLIKILGIIGTPEAIAQLKRFTKFDAREIKFRTYIALLETNQAVDNRTAYTLGTTDEYRHDLYDELKRINKLKLFPPGFLSQKELGKSKIYDAVSEEEGEAGMILDAGERVLLYKGKQQRFYLYKVSLLEDEGFYLGIAGPYSTDLKNFSSSHEVTGLYWDEAFDAKQLDKFLADYLAAFEEVAIEPPPGVEIKKD